MSVMITKARVTDIRFVRTDEDGEVFLDVEYQAIDDNGDLEPDILRLQKKSILGWEPKCGSIAELRIEFTHDCEDE